MLGTLFFIVCSVGALRRQDTHKGNSPWGDLSRLMPWDDKGGKGHVEFPELGRHVGGQDQHRHHSSLAMRRPAGRRRALDDGDTSRVGEEGQVLALLPSFASRVGGGRKEGRRQRVLRQMRLLSGDTEGGGGRASKCPEGCTKRGTCNEELGR